MIHWKTTMREVRYKVLCSLTVLIFAVLVPAVQSQGREITDMFGRKLPISNRPQKVFSASPPMTNLLYAIDPTMLAGLNVPVREHEKKYLRKEMQSLPVLGGWFGQANTPNIEMILKVKPEVIIVQKFGSTVSSMVNETVMKAVPAPVVSVKLATVFDYPGVTLYLGSILGREARAKKLASYAQKTIADMKNFVAGIPEKKKISVYYAEGVDGLNTDCDISMHTELINLAGGCNVHHCEARDMYGMEKISFEQVMIYNPDVILVFEDAFYRTIFADSRWQLLRAVKNKRVYLIPNQPFNWFDRPPSFMRLLGAKWLANLLYPERYRTNIVKEAQRFFKLFLGVNLTAEEAGRLVQAR
ncbi:MAG: ABC transporter substrate-binding protein [Syntrophaceae bacterium]